MAGPLVGLGRRFKRAGLDVVAVDGWRERGYDDFDPRGTVFHHTASNRHSGPAPSLGIVTHGRAGIPGPLCNILIARNGKIFLVAGGKANHAGLGGPLRGIPRDSANRYTVGFEVENDGVGERWSRELIRACDLAFAITLEFVKERAGRHFGHKEWAPDRKIDPARLDMDDDRRRVRRLLRGLDREKKRRRPKGHR
ncbi:MAG: N-acetylmuramoyl-L-alanine amidase [Actinomycetota bacterium]